MQKAFIRGAFSILGLCFFSNQALSIECKAVIDQGIWSFTEESYARNLVTKYAHNKCMLSSSQRDSGGTLAGFFNSVQLDFGFSQEEVSIENICDDFKFEREDNIKKASKGRFISPETYDLLVNCDPDNATKIRVINEDLSKMPGGFRVEMSYIPSVVPADQIKLQEYKINIEGGRCKNQENFYNRKLLSIAKEGAYWTEKSGIKIEPYEGVSFHCVHDSHRNFVDSSDVNRKLAVVSGLVSIRKSTNPDRNDGEEPRYSIPDQIQISNEHYPICLEIAKQDQAKALIYAKNTCAGLGVWRPTGDTVKYGHYTSVNGEKNDGLPSEVWKPLVQKMEGRLMCNMVTYINSPKGYGYFAIYPDREFLNPVCARIDP